MTTTQTVRALVVACGNPLRRDDGAAHVALARLARLDAPPGTEAYGVAQLTPEVAAQLAGVDVVVFVDADVRVAETTLAPVGPAAPAHPLTHQASPEGVVALARALYGFAGDAYVCGIPVEDLAPGEGLSPRAAAGAIVAADRVAALLRGRPER